MRMKALAPKLSRRTLVALALLAPIPCSLWLLRQGAQEASGPPLLAAVAPLVPPAPVAPIPERISRTFHLRSGQTFTQLFLELGVADSEVATAVAATSRFVDTRRVRAGEQGMAFLDATGALQEMRFKVSKKGWLTLVREDGTWRSSWRDMVTKVDLRLVEGQLDSFLFDDLRRAGGSPQLAFAMSDVLQWDLDFDRDLQKGDKFGVVFEEISLDGEKNGIGKIVALYYQNKGKRHEAYLYGDENQSPAYFDAEGRPLQKMFLRSPLPFMRVTSKFSHSRLHPVLKVYRPHYGVDLGAPMGTPVRATAGGTVTFAASSGGAGRMVTVRHTQGFETSYLHLSKIGDGVRVGARIGQGDIVGLVGNSGHSTAPHLDYRVKKNGQYLDPMGMKNVQVEPIAQYRLAQFLQHRNACRASLLEGAPVEDLRLANLPTARDTSAAISSKTAR
jgi:murein DD-endopeptidase MepM/ murein hydrolase activator NlpD